MLIFAVSKVSTEDVRTCNECHLLFSICLVRFDGERASLSIILLGE